jgi:hypothetical protein
MTEAHVHADRPPTDGSVPVLIEPLVLFADRAGIHEVVLEPPVRLPCRDEPHPNEAVAAEARRLGLEPMFVHSTSWRIEGGAVVLTYVVCVPTDGDHRARPVVDAQPISGTALDPPATIDHEHIVGHALRHLAWLSEHDPAAVQILEPWRPHLAAHRPAPFRQLHRPATPPEDQNLGVSR